MRLTRDGRPANKARRSLVSKPESFDDYLHSLRDGEISFNQFHDATASKWAALAKTLHRRWVGAMGVDIEDLTQELLLAAWCFLPRWEPERGVSLERFIVFNSMDKAKKWLHKRRGANLDGNADANPSRCETHEVEGTKERPSIQEFSHDESIARLERVFQLSQGRGEKFTCVLARLAFTPSVELVALELYRDLRLRREYRLCSEGHAISSVRKILKSVATA